MTADGRRGHVSVSRHWLADPTLTDSDLRLMLWLDSHTDSYLNNLNASTTAEQIGWSRNRVKRTIAHLEELGLIDTEQFKMKGGGTRTHITIHLDLWTDGQSLTSDNDGPRRTGALVHGEARALVHGDATTTSKSNGEESSLETPTPAVVEVLDPSDFDMFWSDYPRKIGKPVAKRAFQKAAKEFDSMVVVAGTLPWCEFWTKARTEEQFIPHPSTFLNQHRFNDRPPATVDKSDAMSVLHRMANRSR